MLCFHDDRPVHAKGMCCSCYMLEYRQLHPTTPETRQKAVEVARKYRKDNPEKAKASAHAAHLKKTYQIDINQYNDMLIKQNNGCAICGAKTKTHKCSKLTVDHCHTTNIIRGLLCHNCNAGLGNFSDNIGLLEKAIGYLRRFSE